jgi:hypothetical protein
MSDWQLSAPWPEIITGNVERCAASPRLSEKARHV